MKHPINDSPFTLEADTEEVEDAQVTFLVTWDCDHADWDSTIKSGKNYVDHRGIPDKSGLPLVKKNTGDTTSHDWKVHNWKGIGSNEKEIYAVIRAEYRLIKTNGWTKLHAKTYSQGIDSLFKKGTGRKRKYAIVESKCSANRAEYEQYTKLTDPHSPLGKLGRPMGVYVDNKPVSANGIRQMSDPWICSAIRQEQGGNADPAVIENLKAFGKWMYVGAKRKPLRYLNVYAPPTTGFYLLGGEYAVRCRVGRLNRPEQFPSGPDRGKAELNVASKGTLKVDWADEAFREPEFFALDKQSAEAKDPRGFFHNFADAFEKLVRRDNINKPRSAKAVTEAVSDFND